MNACVWALMMNHGYCRCFVLSAFPIFCIHFLAQIYGKIKYLRPSKIAIDPYSMNVALINFDTQLYRNNELNSHGLWKAMAIWKQRMCVWPEKSVKIVANCLAQNIYHRFVRAVLTLRPNQHSANIRTLSTPIHTHCCTHIHIPYTYSWIGHVLDVNQPDYLLTNARIFDFTYARKISRRRRRGRRRKGRKQNRWLCFACVCVLHGLIACDTSAYFRAIVR